MDDRFMFRVWDKTISKYLDFMCLFDDGQIGRETEISNNRYDNDAVVIEFSTGLLDKNGKLIYEGDLVKIYCAISGSKIEKFRTCKIVWGNFYLPAFEFHIWHKKEWWGHSRADFSKGIEIIGNHFENPELLKEIEK